MENIFEYERELPAREFKEVSDSLIGFKERFLFLQKHMELLMNPEGLNNWAKKFNIKGLPALDVIKNRYPLMVFEGDVGTGKTATAESVADAMMRKLQKEGTLLKLSTSIRGKGLHGEMSKLIQDAFKVVEEKAGKRKHVFLIIDEADAIAMKRGTSQMHQEEKAGVNTLIQKIDEIRKFNGRVVVILCTNRIQYLDEALVRRTMIRMSFDRPNENERLELFKRDLDGISLRESELHELVKLTGGTDDNPGHTFSDIRLKVLPEAIAKAYPNTALDFQILKESIQNVIPSPSIQ